MKEALQEIRRGFLRGTGIFLALLLGTATTYALADALNVFSTGEIVSASKLNANFEKMAPVGTILAWHKSMSGAPALPAGWIECNGQSINDAESPFNGGSAPNLNSPTNAWNSRGVFLRGHSTSGLFENDQFQGHRVGPLTETWFLTASAGGLLISTAAAGPIAGVSLETTSGNPVAGSNGAIRQGDETRSVNMSVVWIMRIK